MLRARVSWAMAALLPAVATGCGTFVQPGYKGLLDSPFTSGLQPKVYDNGFHWHSPFSDMITFDTTWSTSTETIHTISAEGLHLEVLVAIRYRPVVLELYGLVTDVGVNYYDEVLGPEFRTATRGEFARYRYLDITTHNEELENQIEDEIRRRIAGKHIEIDSVTIEHIDYPDDIARAVEEKLVVGQKAEEAKRELDLAQKQAEVEKAQTQGEAEAALIKAQSDADVARVRAEAQAASTTLLAGADADARRTRAQADADAARMLSMALTPSALTYRSLEALERLGASGAKFFLFPGEWHKLPVLLTGE